jgi:hypothetical protein
MVQARDASVPLSASPSFVPMEFGGRRGRSHTRGFGEFAARRQSKVIRLRVSLLTLINRIEKHSRIELNRPLELRNWLAKRSLTAPHRLDWQRQPNVCCSLNRRRCVAATRIHLKSLNVFGNRLLPLSPTVSLLFVCCCLHLVVDGFFNKKVNYIEVIRCLIEVIRCLVDNDRNQLLLLQKKINWQHYDVLRLVYNLTLL